MINVSNEFRELMGTRTDFKQNAEITFVNGTVLELTEKDFTVDNNSVSDGAESNGIPLGVAVCRSVQIELMNDDDRFSEYDFFGARIRLYLTFQLSATVERIEYGTFTVLTPETYGETVIITALDDMHKADAKYATGMSYPATIGSILIDVCDTLDIPLGTTTFNNDNFTVSVMPEDITFRQMIGYIAMIAGGNARIDTTGRLRIISYDFEKVNKISNYVYDGGQFLPWSDKANLDGGSFNPWTEGDIVDGGVFGDRDDLHVLYNWSNLKVDTDDVVITGVKTTYTDDNNNDQEEIYGTDGYILQVSNPLFYGKESEAVNLIGTVMVGGRFRQFSGDLIADPTVEFMDLALLLDRKGNTYISVITDVNFQFFGFTTVKNSAEPALRNSAESYSQVAQSFVNARKLIKKEQTARELAVAQLANDLANSSGLYTTTETQADGSSIYYMHDKPTLKESKIVWKLTALAFGISTDGGKTYPYGFTVDAETITRLLYAEGIDADYLNSGTITVGGSGKGIGMIVVKTAAGVEVGRWSPDGISAIGTFQSRGMNEWNYNTRTSELKDGTLIISENGAVESKFSLVKIADDIFGTGLGTTLSEFGIGFLTNDGNTLTSYYIINNGSNRNGFTERHLFNGSVRFLTGPRAANFYLMPSNTSVDDNEWVRLYRGTYDGANAAIVNAGFYAYGSIGCSGTKYRVVDTEHYGKRGMNAFETAEPYFSDIGSGEIGENGICRIDFDPIFVETIEGDRPYHVQITRTSEKTTEWVEKQNGHFIVHGEPGAKFDWMLMCKQKGYAGVRMQKVIIQEVEENE